MEAILVIILSLLAGIVQCQKRISPPESTAQSTEAKLIILDTQLSIISPPKDVTEIIGEEARFKFGISMEFNVMQLLHDGDLIYYYQDGAGKFPTDKQINKYSIEITRGTITLTVKDLKYADGGTYTCVVIKQEKSASLVVLGKPQLTTSSPKLVEGSTTRFFCSADFGGPPKKDISDEQYPKLRLLIDGVPWTDKEESRDAIGYFQLFQCHWVTLVADMDGKKVECEVYTLRPAKSRVKALEINVLLSGKKTSGAGTIRVDWMLCVLLTIVNLVYWYALQTL